jgi:hypothetical protein
MMLRVSPNLIGAPVLLLAMAGHAVAQTRSQAPATPAPAAPVAQAPAAPSAPAAPAARTAPEAPKKAGQLVNVKIEFTITDERAGTQPAKRTVSLIVADAQRGSVRSEPSAFQVPGVLQLNVDAQPEIVSSGKIRLNFSFQYSAPTPGSLSGETPRGTVLTTNLRESLSLVVEDGKPLLVAQSADPTSDRTVSVEVKATILK